jgi:hypothetical protein
MENLFGVATVVGKRRFSFVSTNSVPTPQRKSYGHKTQSKAISCQGAEEVHADRAPNRRFRESPLVTRGITAARHKGRLKEGRIAGHEVQKHHIRQGADRRAEATDGGGR